MKTLKLITIGMALFLAGSLQAQVTVTLNLGSPPPWGPIGYTEAHYYYLPDVEAFYDVQSSTFIYYTGGKWVHRNYLPRRYRNYDLYGGYKVVMTDYHGNAPYSHFKEYRSKYGRGYHGQRQKTIGERPGNANPRGKPFFKGNSDRKVYQGHGSRVGDRNDKNSKKGSGQKGRNGKK